MSGWIQEHHTLIRWLAILSATMFVATIIAVPILLIRIPADYFTNRKRTKPWHRAPAFVRTVLDVAGNVVGVVLILAGVAMLVLPGQGVLAILAGLILVDFPGKERFEQWIVARGPVTRSINWLRKRGGKPPLAKAKKAR